MIDQGTGYMTTFTGKQFRHGGPYLESICIEGETWRVYQFSADALIRTCMNDYIVREKVKRSGTPLRRRSSASEGR